MNFVNTLSAVSNITTTENGATAYRSTGSDVLNLFSNGGGLRLGKNSEAVVEMFRRAYAENKTLALKVIFYLRDVRHGQGEREIFRKCMVYLANAYPQDIEKLIKHIPEFGRWDDLYAFYGTSKFSDAMNIVASQLAADEKAEAPSLCAKWLKSENTSSKASRVLARATAKALKLTIPAYRKMLSRLRMKVDLLETKISKKQYSMVDYGKIPSQASLKYKKAFGRNDFARFSEFLSKVEKGEAKMNMGTVYPHQIVAPLMNSYLVDPLEARTAEAAWKSLPDYFNGAEEDMLVVADVSGSMSGEPMCVSVSLALYAAEHNKGAWAGKFMTFSEQPTFVTVKGATLADKVKGIMRADWGMSTNIEAVFNQVLLAGKSCGTMVKRIVVISDMEFNQATRQSSRMESLFDNKRREFQAAGFEMPSMTFWNVRARPNNFPAMSGDVQLVSGCSGSTYENIIKGSFPDPYAFMMSVIDTPRYEMIKVEA